MRELQSKTPGFPDVKGLKTGFLHRECEVLKVMAEEIMTRAMAEADDPVSWRGVERGVRNGTCGNSPTTYRCSLTANSIDIPDPLLLCYP